MTAPAPAPTPVAGVIAAFAGFGKSVVTLVGYSGSGYQRPDQLFHHVTGILDGLDPATALVNIGVTEDGIGHAYAWAKERGFATTGIVATAVLAFAPVLAADCDHVFVVEDSACGGYVDGRISPVSEAMVSVSHQMIAIGGGDVVRDELLEMQKRGKPVRFIAADMNHLRALAKAWGKGLPAPKPADLQGSAHARFAS